MPLVFLYSAVWLFFIDLPFPEKKKEKDIMCNDITCEDLHLASVAGMDDITYDDLKPETCVEICGMRVDKGDFE